MGHYVNPTSMSKEAFLDTFGIKMTEKDFKTCNFSMLNDDAGMVVVLIDNGAFKAALICYSHAEYEYIKNNPDSRPKQYFLVPIANLQEFLK